MKRAPVSLEIDSLYLKAGDSMVQEASDIHVLSNTHPQISFKSLERYETLIRRRNVLAIIATT